MRVILVWLFAGLLPISAWAQESVTMTYQGHLASAAGNPVTASHPMMFKLYRQVNGGEPVWTELHGGVEVVDGTFSVDLGTVTALDAALSDEPMLYLGVTVGENDEMTPRVRVGGALKAQWARVADHARDVRGENIHPATVSIGDTEVINSDGQWVGDPTGLVGPAGDRGPAGAQGDPGPAGAQGTPGPAGIQGPAGDQGPEGPRGIQGEVGPAGAAGEQGPPGERGPEGPAGEPGDQGPVGPAPDLSADGDLDGVADWIELAMGTDPTDGADAPGDVNGDGIPDAMVGPQGAQGTQGVAGTQGEAGPAGAQGPAGAPGLAGAQGVQGPAGPAGAPGPIGAPGISVTDAVIDNGDLLLRLATGETINAGRVQGEPGAAVDLNQDSDEDGVADWLEVALNTDPNDGDSTPVDANDDGVPDGLAGGGNAGGGNAGGNAGGMNNMGGGLLSVAVGFETICGVRSDGTRFPLCFGYLRGRVNVVGPVKQVVPFYREGNGGDYTHCVIRMDDTLFCNGTEGHGLLNPPDGQFSTIESGHRIGCGIRTDQSLACWGQDWNHSLMSDAPVDGAFIDIAGGYYHYCALRSSGEPVCWGREENVGEVPPGPFVEISANNDGTCALAEDGSVSCWGSGNSLTPPNMNLSRLASTTHAYSRHMCAIKDDGTIVCWGQNTYGEAWPVPPGTYTDVSIGYHATCGMREDGATVCWGRTGIHGNGQPRLGCTVESGIPFGAGYYCVH